MACVSSSTAMAERISWYCTLLVALMLALSCCDPGEPSLAELGAVIRQKNRDLNRPCDEIYLVREGETLQTIGDKCGDPYIVEQNPHIHDPDDVFPGLVIKITPSNKR
ncbi:LysM domain-containing protein [Psidium guajava]|nr:LysM domain-containing protein [Psidium guajava]